MTEPRELTGREMAALINAKDAKGHFIIPRVRQIGEAEAPAILRAYERTQFLGKPEGLTLDDMRHLLARLNATRKEVDSRIKMPEYPTSSAMPIRLAAR